VVCRCAFNQSHQQELRVSGLYRIRLPLPRLVFRLVVLLPLLVLLPRLFCLVVLLPLLVLLPRQVFCPILLPRQR
jgi:hypothetical protein